MRQTRRAFALLNRFRNPSISAASAQRTAFSPSSSCALVAFSTSTHQKPSFGQNSVDGTSPYIRRSLARDWTLEELEDAVEQGYRHPQVDVENCLMNGDLKEAMTIFDGFKAFAETKTWGQILWAHGKQGNLKTMAELYMDMTRSHGIRPTEPIYCTMVKAMNRFKAFDAVFKLYEEEMKPRSYLRLTNNIFVHMMRACEAAKRKDVAEEMWDDYNNHYERESNDLLWTSRVLVAVACNDWPMINTICQEMDAKSKRLRTPGFRAIMGIIPETGMNKSIQRLSLKLRKTDPQYSVKPW
eukprot:CAMPEP_0114508074 /NCGR_PEP_ID=MMETSP0109-20121206/12382_1 /TAXON_ID=29199 /ORGANISM="Chlorarachnion reptans, Strain CCCM449" /LENGTH=297 /DNA_ID=CAMNT_0001686935 /DNA_START=185 /DNA_END=1075 /DNA_ORIENTATION=+